MRSIALALVLAAPLSAVAAPLTFTRPTRVHQEKVQTVFVTLVNHTAQDREVVVGNQKYKIELFQSLNVQLPVGSDVRVYSETNSKINGQVLMQVSAADQSKTVYIR